MLSYFNGAFTLCRGRINGGGCDINALGLLPDKLKTELALHVNLETLKKVYSLLQAPPSDVACRTVHSVDKKSSRPKSFPSHMGP